MLVFTVDTQLHFPQKSRSVYGCNHSAIRFGKDIIMPTYTSKSNDYGGSGLGLLGETLPDTIKVEHVLTLQIPSKWDRAIRRWVDKGLELSMQYAESFHYIAVGLGSYFFFLGCAKVLEAGSSHRSSSNDDGSSSNKRREKAKNKNPKGKESTAATTTTNSKATSTKASSTTPKATIVDVPPKDSEPKK